MFEASKALMRRYRDGAYMTRYFVGAGIDIGAGPDTIGRYTKLFPAMGSVRAWDMPDGDAQYLRGVEDGRYSFLHSSHCLEHMVDPLEALHNWIRVVKPGGFLIITIPDEDLYEKGVWPSNKNPDHKHTFTMHKEKSWSPVSISVLDLCKHFTQKVETERVIKVLDFFFDLPETDETLTPTTECSIEFVWRKRG